MARQFSPQHIEQMFKYIFEYSGFEVDGFDRQNRIIAYPSNNNQMFAFPMTKDGQILEGVRSYDLDIMTPPDELLYCAKIILGEKKFKKMKKILDNSTFKEILDILKPELWINYSLSRSKQKFVIFCRYTKEGVLKMITDLEDTYDAIAWYDFNPDGSAVLKACWDNEDTKYPPETFMSIIDYAQEIMDEKGFLKVWFNKLFHKGEYEFSFRDCLRIYDYYKHEENRVQDRI
ncbi:hypothetical protein J6O86_08320 [bacterium]|nr:hypothetical protein [bacterium]